MTQLHDDLVAVRDLLSDPTRWTKGHWARDANGLLPVTIADACSFCLYACHPVMITLDIVLWEAMKSAAQTPGSIPLNDALNLPGRYSQPRTGNVACGGSMPSWATIAL